MLKHGLARCGDDMAISELSGSGWMSHLYVKTAFVVAGLTMPQCAFTFDHHRCLATTSQVGVGLRRNEQDMILGGVSYRVERCLPGQRPAAAKQIAGVLGKQG